MCKKPNGPAESEYMRAYELVKTCVGGEMTYRDRVHGGIPFNALR